MTTQSLNTVKKWYEVHHWHREHLFFPQSFIWDLRRSIYLLQTDCPSFLHQSEFFSLFFKVLAFFFNWFFIFFCSFLSDLFFEDFFDSFLEDFFEDLSDTSLDEFFADFFDVFFEDFFEAFFEDFFDFFDNFFNAFFNAFFDRFFLLSLLFPLTSALMKNKHSMITGNFDYTKLHQRNILEHTDLTASSESDPAASIWLFRHWSAVESSESGVGTDWTSKITNKTTRQATRKNWNKIWMNELRS